MIRKLILVLFFPLIISCSDGSVSNPQTDNDDETPSNPEWLIWLTENYNAIESIDSEDFTDLQFLKAVIGERSLLQLGESAHGVKEFSKMKIRLIKFFHEEMDFDVIAFESSIFSNYYVDGHYNEYSTAEMMQKSIFQVWHTQEVLELFEYIKVTKNRENPLYLAGFDIQPLYHQEPEEKRGEAIYEMIYPIDQDYAAEVKALEDSFVTSNRQYIDNRPGGVRTLKSKFESYLPRYEELEVFIDNNMADIVGNYPGDAIKPLYLAQTVGSIIEYINALLYEDDFDIISLFNIRDSAMAGNIDFLIENAFPGRKIMIWAHNSHISHKNTGTNTWKPMGQWLCEKYREELYSIGLYMGRGSAAANNRVVYNIINCPIGSLEHRLSLQNEDCLFIDILNHQQVNGNSWLFSSIQALSAGLSITSIVPAERYDGILYIHTVTPPDYYTFPIQ
ncbi:erythromycin esterase family protein [candidate division KSB1 bacterium]